MAEGSFPFVSRGDKSGTNTKELAFWAKTGIDPKGEILVPGSGPGYGKDPADCQ